MLSLHMKIISSISTFTRCGRIVNYLSEEWGFLTGLVRNLPADAGFVRSKESSVPVLMQDPITVLLHFVLLLPPGVDLGKLWLQPYFGETTTVLHRFS